MKKCIACVCFSVVCSSASVQAGVVKRVVDEFNTASESQMLGDRQVDSFEFANDFGLGSSFLLDPNFDTGSDIGALVMQSDPGVGREGMIKYNGNGVGLDLDATLLDDFALEFRSVDVSFVMQVQMKTYGADGQVQGAAIWAIHVSEGEYVEESWSFSDVTVIQGAFQRTDVDEVLVRFNLATNSTEDLDFVASRLTTSIIPAPSTSIMFGVAAWAALGARRRTQVS